MAMGVLSSARTRRRLAWAGAATGAVAAAIAAILLLPSSEPPKPVSPAAGPPAQVPVNQRQVPLRAVDRRAIDRLLDRFVPAAVERKDPGAAFALATTELRGGTTRADWAKGDIPVYPYDAKGARFHDWSVEYSFAREAGLELMLMPQRPRKQGPMIFKIGVKRVGARWLVSDFQPGATLSPIGAPAQVIAATDFGPVTSRNTSGQASVGAIWLAIPGALVAALVLVPLVLVLRGWISGRRYRPRRSALPPLPAPVRRDEPPA